jgi:hypothetical protein
MNFISTLKALIAKPRPRFLTALCLGSVISGVLWIAMYVTLIVMSVRNNATSVVFPGLVLEYLQAGYIFIVAEIILTALAITGVVMMWLLRKNGFFLYASAKAFLYFLPVLYIGNRHLTYFGLIFTASLIAVYGVIITNYKKMAEKND